MENLRVTSVRVYYLDKNRRIEETDKFVYGMEDKNLKRFQYKNGKQMKEWAEKKMKVDKARNYKLEVRTTKGRYLYDKR